MVIYILVKELIQYMKLFIIAIMGALYQYEKYLWHVNCKKEITKYVHICCDPNSIYERRAYKYRHTKMKSVAS